MGFFSFKTQDTKKSIANSYSIRKTFRVYMRDDKGNVWVEDNYEGYGEFGGKDYYELLAEMNNKTGRNEGITLSFSKIPHITPNLTESEDWEWTNDEPQRCEYQGYFY